MKKFFRYLFILIFILLVIILIKTFLFKSRQIAPVGERKNYPVDTAAIRHLSDAIKISTVSYDDSSLINYSSFDSLFSYLQRTYPLSFSKIEVSRINGHSLLLHWKGKSPDKPEIFYAHLDVVPVDSSTLSEWKHQPFQGYSDDKFIYGRGVIDDKGSVISILEASEKLLAENFTPAEDIYFAFGHDEEASGVKGAKQIANELEKRNVKAEFLLDEGGLIATGMVPFVKSPVALIATSEKGYLSVELTVKSNGGHSSHPSQNPPIEILSRAIKNLHDHPFERKMNESLNDFMDYAGPEMRMPFKSIFANRWLFRPIVFNEYEKIPSANAMIRTTEVATIIRGGMKDNVIPTEARAIINLRLIPGDRSEDVLKRIKEIIADTSVNINIFGAVSEASGVSAVNSESFQNLQRTIKEVFPDVIVAPTILIGQTDSRHFKKVTKNIYRFLPVRMTDEILDGMHGKDEKMEVGSMMESIEFYKKIMTSHFDSAQ